jgi:hypothetical protein
MKWTRTGFGLIAERAEATPAELLVAILGGDDAPANLLEVAGEWAAALPFGAFVVFETLTDSAARIARSLAHVRVAQGRVLLVGMGQSGGVCINLVFRGRTSLVGMLVYDPPAASIALVASLDRSVKVRLVGLGSDDPRHELLPGILVRRLRLLGIDARATQLLEREFSRPAIRIGLAYLTELSAAALERSHRSAHPSPNPIAATTEPDHAP